MKNPIVELTLHTTKGDLEAAFVVIYRDGKTVRLTGVEAEAAIKRVVPAVGTINPKGIPGKKLAVPKRFRGTPKKK